MLSFALPFLLLLLLHNPPANSESPPEILPFPCENARDHMENFRQTREQVLLKHKSAQWRAYQMKYKFDEMAERQSSLNDRLIQCGDPNSKLQASRLQAEAVVNDSNRFSFALSKEVFEEEKAANLVMSSSSVSTVLAMLRVGARGDTLEQMTAALFSANSISTGYKHLLPKLKSEDFTLATANKIFLGEGFSPKKSFLDIVSRDFYSEVGEVDFVRKDSAAKTINEWVENQTGNKIKDIVNPGMFDDDTKVVLVNAIYFKAEWAKKFYKSLTKKEPFTTACVTCIGRELLVPMMKMEGYFKLLNLTEIESMVIQIPYAGERVVMEIVLPNIPLDREGVQQIGKDLENTDFERRLEKQHKKNVHLEIPKFKIESKIRLVSILKRLGMEDMFEEGDADFGGISDRPLYISEAVQKAFIKVDEFGTEAAAATVVVGAMPVSLPLEPPEKFVANRPFLFYVRDLQTKLLLFQGMVTAPSEEE